MTSNAGCWRRPLAVLGLATSLLSACATVGSNGSWNWSCPPVAEYSREFQTRATEELNSLADGSAIPEMLSDYSVMRDQARVCR